MNDCSQRKEYGAIYVVPLDSRQRAQMSTIEENEYAASDETCKAECSNEVRIAVCEREVRAHLPRHYVVHNLGQASC